MSPNASILPLLLAVGVMAACSHERAALAVELPPPVAAPVVEHGNCFVGWILEAPLVVHETGGADTVLDRVTGRVEDERSGALLGEDAVDAAALRDRPGASGADLAAHGSLRVPLSIHLPGSAEGPAFSGRVVATGVVQAHDGQGSLSLPYRIAAEVMIKGGPLPGAGACAPS